MRILGVKLKTPAVFDLVPVMVVGGIVTVAAAALVSSHVISLSAGVSFAAGMTGGSLGNAYGAAEEGNGSRGIVVGMFFGVGLALIVLALLGEVT